MAIEKKKKKKKKKKRSERYYSPERPATTKRKWNDQRPVN